MVGIEEVIDIVDRSRPELGSPVRTSVCAILNRFELELAKQMSMLKGGAGDMFQL